MAKTGETMTHCDRLIAYLRVHKQIFPLVAIAQLGNTRLADTVYKLRKKEYDIRTEMVEVPTRFGTRTEVAKYVLLAEPK
jgi:hypothetical protein